jgi:hypothetical protein
MHLRLSAVRRALFQLAFSSSTHGATRRPYRVHSSSVAVLVIVIFSISSFFLSLQSANAWPEQRILTKHDESLSD